MVRSRPLSTDCRPFEERRRTWRVAVGGRTSHVPQPTGVVLTCSSGAQSYIFHPRASRPLVAFVLGTIARLVGCGGHAQSDAAPFHLPSLLAFCSGISDSVNLDQQGRGPYRGGRLVLGVGSSWPHDFRFFVGFLSSSLLQDDDLKDSGDVGVKREVSAKEMVPCGP